MADLSRRSFLAASAAAGIVPSVAHGPVHLGFNRGAWDRASLAVPGAKCVRVYYQGVNQIPQHWPSRLPGTWTTLSIRPHPRDLLAGKLDAQIRALVTSAPAHARLNCWHEAGGNNPLGYPSYIRPQSIRKIHAYMLGLCKGTSVRYGFIICGPADQLEEWLYPTDWCGIDSYDNPRWWNKDHTLNRDLMWSRYYADKKVFAKLTGRAHPQIDICESNSPLDRHRKNWFAWQAQWLSMNGNHSRLLTSWFAAHGKTQGGLSGPWPPSKPVIAALNQITRAYQ